MLIFIYNFAMSFRTGKVAGPNPWGARTLEWMISSPPPYYNYKKIPAVLATPYDFGNPLPYIGLEAAAGAGRSDADGRVASGADLLMSVSIAKQGDSWPRARRPRARTGDL